MKIGLMTIHHAYNFGAMLQSYATLRVLEDLGHDVEFIDYDNKTFAEERRIFLPCNSVGNLFRNIRSILQFKQLRKRIVLYENFYEKFKVSKFNYNHININDVRGYDVIITGSDQTFSLYLTENPIDIRPFFLENIKCSKKISYASSMGEKFHKLTSEDDVWMKKCFADFDHLSVRERGSADYIEKLTGMRPEVVLDPTLLRSAEQWSLDATDTDEVKGDYIAFYTVLSEPWVINYVERFALKTGLKVIAMHQRTRFELKTKFNYVNSLGPSEFLSVIKNAKYVITTSFHATAFSIIFQKQFVSLKIGKGNRLSSLLNLLSLEKHLVSEDYYEDFAILKDQIDFSNSMELLNKERDVSLNYLIDALK